VELLPVVLTSGWASGINAYLVVLVLGLIGRFTAVAGIPEGLTRTDVLVVAAVLYLVELVADKIPYFDSLWDAVSTAIRATPWARSSGCSSRRTRRRWSRRSWPCPAVPPR